MRLSDHCFVQEVHGQTTEAQILVSADWVADVSVSGVGVFVSEPVNRHGQELHAILEIVIDVCGGSPFHIEPRFSKRLRPGLVRSQSAESISNDFEAFFDRLSVLASIEQLTTS